MEVGLIILLEFSCLKLSLVDSTDKCFQLNHQVFEALLIIGSADWCGHWWGLFTLLTGFCLLRSLNYNDLFDIGLSLARSCNLSDLLNVSNLLDSQVEGDQVGAGVYKAEMS